jgi:AAA+ superfamily predicted ATPase
MNEDNLMTMMMMGNNGGGRGKEGEGISGMLSGMFFALFNVILIGSIGQIKKVMNIIFEKGGEYLKKTTDMKFEKLGLEFPDIMPVDTVLKSKKHEKYKVTIKYRKDDPDSNIKNNGMDYKYMKGLFYKFSKLHHIPELYLTKEQFVPYYLKQPFELTDDIVCEIEQMTFTTDNNVNSCVIILSSKNKSSSELSKEVSKIYQEYENEKEMTLNNDVYVFDINMENTRSLYEKGVDRDMIVRSASPRLAFTKTKFYSNRCFDNVMGKSSESVFERLRFFRENKSWYASKGIPYQFGCLFSGKPGTGKSSSIKAIANELKRHIVNVNLAHIQTSKQLYNLFNNEYIEFYDENRNRESIKIPLDNRLYVLEEIDTLGDMVLDRQYQRSTPVARTGEICLGDILNILDGSNEYPGRVLIMTSNYPDRLDRAILRGGRIDVNVEFMSPDSEEINAFIKFFYDLTYLPSYIFKGCIVSYADLSQVFFSYSPIGDNCDIIYKKIKGIISAKEIETLSFDLQSENETLVERIEFTFPEDFDKLSVSKKNELRSENERIESLNECIDKRNIALEQRQRDKEFSELKKRAALLTQNDSDDSDDSDEIVQS